MIQAPAPQYMQQMQPMPMMPCYQQIGAVNPQPMQQPPYQQQGVFYNYPVASCYQPQMMPTAKSQYNGVNIEIINPQGQGYMPQTGYQMPAQMMPVQQPVYFPTYPQPVSNATVNAPGQQTPVVATAPAPVQTPVVQTVPVEAPVVQPAPVQAPVVQPAPAQTQPVQTAPVQTPAVPEPQIQAAPVVEQPTTVDPSLTPESFAGRLTQSTGLEQRAVIEDIATKVKEDNTIAPLLLDTQIFDALVGVINTDTSALQGPSAEVIALRQKPAEQLSQAELAKANEQSPLEIAEQNKQYALFTISFMQERLNQELEKRNNQTLELKDLPCIDQVVTAVKSNPNPAVRMAGISSLAHIAKPQYKADLTTIFELAKSDEDVNVQNAAAKAIQVINA